MFNEKFRGVISDSLVIWINSPIDSNHIQLDTCWKLKQRKALGDGIYSYSFKSDSVKQELNIHANFPISFWGLQFMLGSGLCYQQNGLVGAQFTHLITHANSVITQLKELKPDFLVFSYGTNESYDDIDSSVYFNKVLEFINRVKSEIPNVGILITNAPDTRSSHRTPRSQKLINGLLSDVATQSHVSYFDLNNAMGGWGSLYEWVKKGYVLKDYLHFNAEGSKVLGQLITYAMLNAANSGDTNIMNPLKTAITAALCKNVVEIDKEEDLNSSDEIKVTNKNFDTENKGATKKRIYIVKKGDSLSSIAHKKHTTVKALLRLNKLSATKLLHPGDKIKF